MNKNFGLIAGHESNCTPQHACSTSHPTARSAQWPARLQFAVGRVLQVHRQDQGSRSHRGSDEGKSEFGKILTSNHFLILCVQPEGGAPGTQPSGQPPNSQMPGGQAYQYSYPNYYGGQGQPPSGMPNQNYGGYPAYGGYGGQPQGPEN